MRQVASESRNEWRIVGLCLVLTAAALLFVTTFFEVTLASEPILPPQLQRPPDSGALRLDRPQREEHRTTRREGHATLDQAEAIKLAKATGKKEVGKQFDDYDLKAVIFEPQDREWSVLFERRPPRAGAHECFYVYVDDETKETRFQPCS